MHLDIRILKNLCGRIDPDELAVDNEAKAKKQIHRKCKQREEFSYSKMNNEGSGKCQVL